MASKPEIAWRFFCPTSRITSSSFIACAWLGVTAVPLNTRLSAKEIDGILNDAKPRGLIRHSSLPVPTAQVSWQLVLDQESLDVQSDSIADPIYDPDAILALIYTSGTTGRPKGVEIRHANTLENVYHTNFCSRLKKVRCICMPRRFFTSPIFRSCSPRQLSAPVRSLFPKFSPESSARQSKTNASRTRCWCRR